MADSGDFVIEAGQLWPGVTPHGGPLALVELDKADDAVPEAVDLPPCPVIGIGNAGHRLAPLLDAVVETPGEAEAIVRQVVANPRAAAAIAQLLRIVPGMPPPEALIAESFAYAMLQGSAEHAAWLARRTPLPASAAAETAGLRVEREGERLTLTLDRPESGNAIDRAMRDRLYEAFALGALDATIGRIRLQAAGRTFSLGADLAEFGTTPDPATAHDIRRRTLPALQAWRCADRLDVHVQGGCVGSGLELAAWGRRITASSDAWFHLPELAMGILPGAGGCVALTRRIGRQRTAQMILSGRRIGARTALAWGLVDAIVDEAA